MIHRHRPLALFLAGALLLIAPAHRADAQVAARTDAQVAARTDAQVAARTDALASFDAAWTAVSRTYWDTLFVQGRWRSAHDSLRASLRANESPEAERRAIRALIAVPGLSHFTLIPGSAVPDPKDAPAARDAGSSGDGGPGTVGLTVRSIGDTLVAWRVTAGGSAAAAGVRPGDAILAIDTARIDALRARIAAGSETDAVTVQRLVTTFALSRLAGSVGDSLRLTFRDGGGRERARTLVRTPMAGRLTQMGNLPPMVVSATRDPLPLGDGREATLIGFTTWLPAISPQLDDFLFASRGTAGLVIDLRGNPGGVVGMLAGVSGHMLDTAIALGVMYGRGATIRFVANPRPVDRTGTRVGVYSGPLAILVDEFTGSTSEFFAAGMQAIGRARIFGTVSAGQSLPALMSRLPNGDMLMHAIADHEDAAGRRVEGAGVRPDELVPLRRVDLRAGRDAPLEAARAWLAMQHP